MNTIFSNKLNFVFDSDMHVCTIRSPLTTQVKLRFFDLPVQVTFFTFSVSP